MRPVWLDSSGWRTIPGRSLPAGAAGCCAGSSGGSGFADYCAVGLAFSSVLVVPGSGRSACGLSRSLDG